MVITEMLCTIIQTIVAVIMTLIRFIFWCAIFGPRNALRVYTRRPIRHFFHTVDENSIESVLEGFPLWMESLPEGHPCFSLVTVDSGESRIPLNRYLQEIAKNRYPIATNKWFGRSVVRATAAATTHEGCWKKFQSAARWALEFEERYPELRAVVIDEQLLTEWQANQAAAAQKIFQLVDGYRTLKLEEQEREALLSGLPEYIERLVSVNAQIEALENNFWWDGRYHLKYYLNEIRRLPGHPADLGTPSARNYFSMLAMLLRRRSAFY